MLEKGKENDKITFIPVANSSVEEKLAAYKAYCILRIDGNPLSNDVLASADWNKDRRKKNIRVPDFNNLNKASKYYTLTPDYRVLVFDKTADFLIRNRVLENCLKAIVMRFDISDMDATPMFTKFNEYYDSILAKLDFSDKIQVLEYPMEKPQDPQASI